MLFLIAIFSVAGLAMAMTPSFEEDISDAKSDAEVNDEDVRDELLSVSENIEAGGQENSSILDFARVAVDAQTEAGEPDSTQAGSDDMDTIAGGDTNDLIEGNAGADELLGEAGNDTIDGGSGDDIISGADGDDVLIGGTGDDALHGRNDNDLLQGDAGEDTLLGGNGDDTLIGFDDSEDYLIGGDGDDVILIGQGDVAYGGHGEDTFFLDAMGDDIGSKEVANFSDFNSEDDLIVVCVNSDQADAVLSMVVSEADPSQSELQINGHTLALLSTENAPDLDDINVLVSEGLPLTA